MKRTQVREKGRKETKLYYYFRIMILKSVQIISWNIDPV